MAVAVAILPEEINEHHIIWKKNDNFIQETDFESLLLLGIL